MADTSYDETVVSDIERMLENDAEKGVINRIAYIAVGQLTWEALCTVGKISDDASETTEAGDQVECTFKVNGVPHHFKVRYDPKNADGFEPRDKDGNMV